MAKVWSWWTGPRPEYIDLCLATMAKQCRDFTLLTDDNFDEHVPPGTLHDNWRKLEPGIASDCVRAALLATHGGFWFDADTICLRDPSEVAGPYDMVYSTWSKSPRRAIAGYCYARPGSAVARKWLDGINDKLANDFSGIKWCSIGEVLLTPLVDAHKGTTLEVDRATWLPVDIDANVPVFFENRSPFEFTEPWTVCYGLNHSYFVSRRPDVMRVSPDEWMVSPIMIHRLLAHAREVLV